jgi:ABC-type multidrug transport system ATPase subunit
MQLFMSSAGTTTLLRTIAGLQAADNPAAVSYNGRNLPSLRSDGVDLRRYTAYCGESDVHEPLLTVRETLTYAAQLTGQGSTASGRVNEIMRTFGIDVAADTIVGK